MCAQLYSFHPEVCILLTSINMISLTISLICDFISVATSNQTSGGYAPYQPMAAPMAPQGSMGGPYNQHPPPAYSIGAAYPGAPMEKGPFQPQY